MAAPATEAEGNPPLMQQIKAFDRSFWITNVMEMLERLAYYGVRTVIPTYMVLSLAQGGPEFDHVQKGSIFAWWALVQSLLPMFTGGFADRYGYKPTIVVAILLKIVGYLMMATFLDYWGFLAGCLTLAAGTAIFKPGVQGILATVMPKKNASVGWGIFYQLVNVGGFLGPWLAGILRLMDWQWVFYSCAIIVSLNFVMLLTFEEPTKRAGAIKDARSPFLVLIQSVGGLFKPRLISFILLFSGFWFMFNQIFDILPNFLDDWVDSAVLWHAFSGFSETAAGYAAENRPFNQEWIINLNPLLIIVAMIPIAWLTNYTTPLRSILGGIAIASIGTLLIGASTSIWIVIAAILVFSVGEMASSPKKMEYLASLAKPGEQGLYMGYANVPLAIGWGLGSLFGGYFYENFGDRTNLAKKYLVEELGYSEKFVSMLPKDDVLPALLSATGSSQAEMIALLWDKYDPWMMWSIFAGIGVASLLGLAVYDLVLRRLDADLPVPEAKPEAA